MRQPAADVTDDTSESKGSAGETRYTSLATNASARSETITPGSGRIKARRSGSAPVLITPSQYAMIQQNEFPNQMVRRGSFPPREVQKAPSLRIEPPTIAVDRRLSFPPRRRLSISESCYTSHITTMAIQREAEVASVKLKMKSDQIVSDAEIKAFAVELVSAFHTKVNFSPCLLSHSSLLPFFVFVSYLLVFSFILLVILLHASFSFLIYLPPYLVVVSRSLFSDRGCPSTQLARNKSIKKQERRRN